MQELRECGSTKQEDLVCATKDSHGSVLYREIETGVCMSFEDQACSEAIASPVHFLQQPRLQQLVPITSILLQTRLPELPSP
jgi:hypothetical protein